MTDQPKTLTEAEVLGAIDSLEMMVGAKGGDVGAKATLLVTTYRVAARTKGLAWADTRFAPIFIKLREDAQDLGQKPAVERILTGIAGVRRQQKMSEAATHDVEALAVLVREMAAAGGPPILTDELLERLENAVQQDPAEVERFVTDGTLGRALAELRRLRARDRGKH